VSWIIDHKNVWRVAVLILLLVAILGPWWFDLIVVPSKYPCSNPFIRLEGDFCGMPMPGIWILVGLVGRPIELVVGLVTGATVSTDSGYAVLYSVLCGLLVRLLVLPFFSTLLLILCGNRWRQQVFHIAAWSLATGAGLLLGIELSRHLWSWALWGIWLYIGLAISALLLEVLTLIGGKQARLGI
jgi:hypothetical protein